MTPFVLGSLFAVGAAVSWAAGAVFARLGMQKVGSTTGTFISLIAGAVVVTALTITVQAQALLTISANTFWWCMALGAIQFPVARFLNYSGIRLAGVAPATSITGTNPLFAALLAMIFLGEAITGLLLAGILAVVVGLTLVTTGRTAQVQRPSGEATPPRTPPETRSKGGLAAKLRGTVVLGLACSLGSSVAYGLVHTLARYLVTGGSPPGVTATYTLFFGTLFLGLMAGPHIRSDMRTGRSGILFMAAAGVCSAFGTLFVYSALARISVSVTSSIAASYPIATLLLTRLFLKRLERVTLRMLVGSILAVLGVILVLLG